MAKCEQCGIEWVGLYSEDGDHCPKCGFELLSDAAISEGQAASKGSNFNNFCRIYEMPPSHNFEDFCFSGPIPVTFNMIDWFQPLPEPAKASDWDGWKDTLRKFVQEKKYCLQGRTYLLVTEFGESLIIKGPSHDAGK